MKRRRKRGECKQRVSQLYFEKLCRDEWRELEKKMEWERKKERDKWQGKN
jgi:hypothetical protein